MIQWYKNISIKYKFLIIFVIFIIFTTLSNIIIINNMKKKNYDTIKIYKNGISDDDELHDVKENLLAVKNLMTLSTFNDNMDYDYVKDQIDEYERENDKILERYEKMDIPETVKPTYIKFKYYLYQVRVLRYAVLDYIKVHDYTSARSIYSQYVVIRNIMYGRLDEVILHLHNNSLRKYNDNLISFNKAYRNILIINLVQFILLIVSGIIFSNYFTRRLKRYVYFAEDIASGTTSDFIAVDSNDEIGQLGKQLNIAGRNIGNYMENLKISELKLKEQLEELSKVEARLSISEERYRLAVEGVSDGIWDIDFMTSRIYLSNKCKEILNVNISEKEITFLQTSKVIESNTYQFVKDLRCYIIECIQTNVEFLTRNIILNINDNLRHILFRGKVLYDEEGNVCRIAGSVTDVTEQNAANDKIKYLAYYDTLTNLPNKISLRESIPELFRGIRDDGLRTLVLIDIDNFKYVNDVYGHEIGDELILELAKRLVDMKGERDSLYYVGEAYFALYSNKYADKIEIDRDAEKINITATSPYVINNNKINITASIGISYVPLYQEGTASILQNAEIALNYCKINKENSFMYFTDDMEKSMKRRVAIYNDLIAAVENEQFTLYYQPKVNIFTGKVEGVEALIRWNHPVKGMIPPNEFILVSEETGIIVDIGYFVIREACGQIKKWHEKGFCSLKMAINLSVKQLMQVDFVEKFKSILETMEVMPQWIEFEITESLVMKNYDDAIFKINELRSFGITIALDDFGTGYSSLNYLSSLPIDSIKLDKSFIDKIIDEEKNKTIIQAFIWLAHSIKLSIVAEGVETEEQLHLLKQLNCDSVQGYLFSKPLPNEEFEQFITKNVS